MLHLLCMRFLVVFVILLSGHSPGARAAGTESAAACAEIESDGQRLACYDRIFRTPAGTEQATLPSTAPVVVASQGEVERRDFGLSDARKRQSANLPAALDSITVTIRSIGRRPTGEQIFRTEEGQVWVEVEPSPRLRVDPGETVTIRRAALGSYMLVTSRRVGTKVVRMN